MIYFKQSTASQEALLGPFVDSTDGNTAETGLTIANTDIKVWKAGATTLANKNSGGGTHISAGNYYAVFDATDTDTLGSGAIVVQVAGALAVRHDFCVLAANVYDALIGGGDLLDVNVSQFGNSNGTFSSGIPAVNATQISGDSTAADNLETAFDDTAGAVPWQGIIDQGTAQSATGTTLVLRAAAAFASSELVGAILVITGGSTGVGQVRAITAYNGGTDTATVDTWTTTPTGTITYKIFAAPPAQATPPAVNVTHFGGSAGTFSSGRPEVNTTHVGGTSQTAGDIIGDTNDIQSRLPAALVSGRIDASVGAMAANVMTAAAAAADLTTELQSGLSTLDAAGVRAAVGLASANLDTQLDALPTAAENATAVWGAGTRALTIIDEDSTTLDLDATIRAAVGLASANLDTQIGTLATAANLATVDTVVDAIKVTTDKLDDTLEDDAGTYRFTANALEEAPSGTGASAAAIADAVWDEALSGHLGAGSTGEALNAAGAAGDPWITTLPGSYTSGQAGYIVGTNLNATVSSRATQTSVDTVDGIVDSILVDTAEIGAAGAGLTALATQASVNDLPTNAELATALQDLPTNAELATALDNLPTATEIADETLTRQFDDVTPGSGTRDLLNANRFIRNGFSIAGSTLTVLQEDDTTPAYTRNLTTDAGAVPIVGVD